MNLSITLQKFISNSETAILNLTKHIESNNIDLEVFPCKFLESRNLKYRNEIQSIEAEVLKAQAVLKSL